MTRVLCLHAAPETIRPTLDARCPDISISYATTVQEAEQILNEQKPEVVFSLKDRVMPAEIHRAAMMADHVKWVHVGGSGYDYLEPIDFDAVTITNSAGLISRHLAETVTGAMIALNGRFFSYHLQQQQRQWQQIPFRPLSEQTLLVVGLGAIGDWVARNAKALGMHVIAIRRRQDAADHVDALYPPESLHEALGEADFVSLHVRANEDTHHMMDAAAFAAMKPGACLINTARGSVVDTNALLNALDSGPVKAAYLDVFEEEPLPADHPLWSREDVFMTPHAADTIVNWQGVFADFFADNLKRWQAGEPLLNQITA